MQTGSRNEAHRSPTGWGGPDLKALTMALSDQKSPFGTRGEKARCPREHQQRKRHSEWLLDGGLKAGRSPCLPSSPRTLWIGYTRKCWAFTPKPELPTAPTASGPESHTWPVAQSALLGQLSLQPGASHTSRPPQCLLLSAPCPQAPNPAQTTALPGSVTLSVLLPV